MESTGKSLPGVARSGRSGGGPCHLGSSPRAWVSSVQGTTPPSVYILFKFFGKLRDNVSHETFSSLAESDFNRNQLTRAQKSPERFVLQLSISTFRRLQQEWSYKHYHCLPTQLICIYHCNIWNSSQILHRFIPFRGLLSQLTNFYFFCQASSETNLH